MAIRNAKGQTVKQDLLEVCKWSVPIVIGFTAAFIDQQTGMRWGLAIVAMVVGLSWIGILGLDYYNYRRDKKGKP